MKVCWQSRAWPLTKSSVDVIGQAEQRMPESELAVGNHGLVVRFGVALGVAGPAEVPGSNPVLVRLVTHDDPRGTVDEARRDEPAVQVQFSQQPR